MEGMEDDHETLQPSQVVQRAGRRKRRIRASAIIAESPWLGWVEMKGEQNTTNKTKKAAEVSVDRHHIQ